MKISLRRTKPYKLLKRITKPLRRRILIEEGLAKSSKMQHSENTDKWHLCKAGSFSHGESPWTPPLEGISLHRWNNSVERPWEILSLFTTCLPFTLPEAVTQTSGIFVKAGSFSYGESPWTPPLEGTSLHQWNNSVERPWGILSLFTTCLPFTLPEAVTQTGGISL